MLSTVMTLCRSPTTLRRRHLGLARELLHHGGAGRLPMNMRRMSCGETWPTPARGCFIFETPAGKAV